MKLKIGALLVATIALSACTMHKVTDKQQICNQAKRQQTLNQLTPGFDAHNITPGQQQQLEQSIQANC